MINAVIFDLDGTLVDTEKLKALSYGKAISQLRANGPTEEQVMQMYAQVVGQTRDNVSKFFISEFGLEEECRAVMPEFGVQEPWQVLTAMRVTIYEEMTKDPQVFRAHQWSHNVELLRIAHAEGCRTALATSSYTEEAHRVLSVLGLADQFDAVIGLNQVKKPKPDPEIYLMAASRLEVSPEECMVIEDSPTGVQAGLAAKMNVIAVATQFTKTGLHNAGFLQHQWVVHDSHSLLEVVRKRIIEHNRSVHGHGEE